MIEISNKLSRTRLLFAKISPIFGKICSIEKKTEFVSFLWLLCTSTSISISIGFLLVRRRVLLQGCIKTLGYTVYLSKHYKTPKFVYRDNLQQHTANFNFLNLSTEVRNVPETSDFKIQILRPKRPIIARNISSTRCMYKLVYD